MRRRSTPTSAPGVDTGTSAIESEEERDSRLIRERAWLAGLIHDAYPDFGFELVPHSIVTPPLGRQDATVLYVQGGDQEMSCAVIDADLLEKGAHYYAEALFVVLRDKGWVRGPRVGRPTPWEIEGHHPRVGVVDH